MEGITGEAVHENSLVNNDDELFDTYAGDIADVLGDMELDAHDSDTDGDILG